MSCKKVYWLTNKLPSSESGLAPPCRAVQRNDRSTIQAHAWMAMKEVFDFRQGRFSDFFFRISFRKHRHKTLFLLSHQNNFIELD